MHEYYAWHYNCTANCRDITWQFVKIWQPRLRHNPDCDKSQENLDLCNRENTSTITVATGLELDTIDNHILKSANFLSENSCHKPRLCGG